MQICNWWLTALVLKIRSLYRTSEGGKLSDDFFYFTSVVCQITFSVFWLRVDLSFEIGVSEERAAFTSGWTKHVQLHIDLIKWTSIVFMQMSCKEYTKTSPLFHLQVSNCLFFFSYDFTLLHFLATHLYNPFSIYSNSIRSAQRKRRHILLKPRCQQTSYAMSKSGRLLFVSLSFMMSGLFICLYVGICLIICLFVQILSLCYG